MFQYRVLPFWVQIDEDIIVSQTIGTIKGRKPFINFQKVIECGKAIQNKIIIHRFNNLGVLDFYKWFPEFTKKLPGQNIVDTKREKSDC